ncbi:MAG: response regulator [Marinilabilia sp.]
MSSYILIIDEDQTNVLLYESLLNMYGYRTKVANSSSEGWNLMQEEKPSLLLLELLISDMSGVELFEKMRAVQELSRIPVIVISSLNDELTADAMLELGAKEYMVKPVNNHTVMEKVKEHCLLT